MKNLFVSLCAIAALAFSAPARAANEIKVVLDNGASQTLKTGLWSAAASLADHRRVIAVFIVKDVAGGPFCDEYSGIDMLSIGQDSDGGLVIHKYTSAQNGKLRVQRTDPTTGGLTSERTIDDAAELVAHGGVVTYDFKPNPTSAELTAARQLAGCQ